MFGSLALLAALGPSPAVLDLDAAERELSEAIGAHELRAHVYRLAGPEFLGRRGPGAARAARHIEAAFRRLGLEPAFGDSYTQAVPAPTAEGRPGRGGYLGRNVAAVLPGADPKLRDEWVIFSAHFDHLGRRGDTLYPGADDNATGVAALLEVAEHFALRKQKPRRTLVFVAFDLEERGLLGSTYFAEHPPRPLRDLKALLVADMLGRSMANVMDEYVFVLGSERSARLRRLVEEVRTPPGLAVGRLGADLIGTRSDYGPFRDRQVPFLFFSTGQHPDYHRPTDTPERVDYAKLRRIAVWVADLLTRLADDDEAPAWAEEPLPPDLDEVRAVRELVRRVLAHPESFPLGAGKRALVGGVEERLGKIVRSGTVTGEDRDWMLWTGRLLLATVF
jgi:hypothetical protein